MAVLGLIQSPFKTIVKSSKRIKLSGGSREAEFL